MSKIEENIKLRVYYTPKNASRAVKLSKLPAKEKKRLLALIPDIYTSEFEKPIPPKPPKEETNGATFHGGKIEPELERDLLRASLFILRIAVKHKLSREQAFDRVRNAMEWGLG